MSEKTWVEVSDWGTVKVGDFVRFEKGRESAEIVVSLTSEACIHPTDPGCFKINDGWTLFVESTPNPLPTEPGLYEDSDGDFWMVNRHGAHVLLSDGGSRASDRAAQDWESRPSALAPFTRLESQADTARKVLERVAECVAVINSDDLHYVTNYVLPQVREEFGVVSS